MKVSQLALAAAAVAILTVSAQAQGPYGGGCPAGYGGQAYAAQAYAGQVYGSQGYAMQGNPGMQGYPMMQGGYPMQAGYAMQGGPAGPGGCCPMQDDGTQAQLFGGGEGGPMPMGGGPGCDQCGGCAMPAQNYCDHLTHWAYADIEVFYARRTMGLVTQPVIETVPVIGILPVPGAVLQTTTGAPEFKYEPGVKGTVGYEFPWAFALEATFEGQNYWTSRSGQESTTSDLTIPPPINSALVDLGSASGGTNAITVSYTSRFDSTEFNFVRPYANIQFLAGTRYIEVNDKYDLNGASSTGSSDYLITSHNHLLGPQLGVRGQWQISRLQFDIESKGGIFANSAGQNQSIYDANNTNPIRSPVGSSNTEVSFVGEVSAYMTVPLCTFLTAKLGYSGIWITDLALAPNQLDFSNGAGSGTALNTHESIIIHGFNAGVEARW